MDKNYSISVTLPILWNDMDAFNHVNNTCYFRYFESARVKYLQTIKFGIKQPLSIGPILKSTYCMFKIPLTYPDTITSMAKVSKINKDHFTMEYIIISKKFNKCAAIGNGIIVSFDYKKKTKTNIPDYIVKEIQSLENNTTL